MNKAKDIQEGNFMIAKFMDFDYPDMQDQCWRISMSDLHNYHEDWRWLMPVIEKISGLGFHVSIHVNKVACSSFIEETSNPENRLYSTNWSTPLLAAYNAVVQFITWYNQNKTS